MCVKVSRLPSLHPSDNSSPVCWRIHLRGLVIIPAHNEGPTIRRVLENLQQLLPEATDILVVNDGSFDNTEQEARAASVRVCSLACNLGYAQALSTGLLAGLRCEDYHWFAFMDADGQHRGEDMAQLIGEIRTDRADLITGSRWLNRNIDDEPIPAGRRLGMKFFAWLTRALTGRQFTDTTSGMKIMKRAVARELVAQNFGDFHSEILIYLHDRGYRLAESPILVHERTVGTSMYSLADAVIYPWKNLILIAVHKLSSQVLKRV